MFHMLGVALCYLLGACPVFVAGTGREISSPCIDKPGILTPIFHSLSGVHVHIVQQLLQVPFRSIPGFIPSPPSGTCTCMKREIGLYVNALCVSTVHALLRMFQHM